VNRWLHRFIEPRFLGHLFQVIVLRPISFIIVNASTPDLPSRVPKVWRTEWGANSLELATSLSISGLNARVELASQKPKDVPVPTGYAEPLQPDSDAEHREQRVPITASRVGLVEHEHYERRP
jgi:hypothetical protein